MSNNIISSLGAGSGIDTKALVDGLVEAEKAPSQSRIDKTKETYEAQLSAYGLMRSTISTFQGVLSPLTNPDTFNARSLAFPQNDFITPDQLQANAAQGTYQLEVDQVAQAQTMVSGEIADIKKPLGAGEVTFRFGSWTDTSTADAPTGFTLNSDKSPLTVKVEAGDTLEKVVEKINKGDSGVQATLLPVNGKHQLMLVAPSGEKQQLEISTTGSTDLDFMAFNQAHGAGGLSQTQQGQDAKIKLNGLALTRESNEINDVINGLEFTVNKATAGEKLSFTISPDKQTAETAVRNFVEAYNALQTTLKNLTAVKDADPAEGVEEKQVGVLSRDSTAKSIQSNISSIVNGVVPGLDSERFLSELGIRTKLDGTLEIDDTKGSDNKTDFERAFDKNFDGLAELFSLGSSTTNSNISIGTSSSVGNISSGTYELEITKEPTKAVTNAANLTSLDLSAGGPHTFKLSLGQDTSKAVQTTEITVPAKVYGTGDELAKELQALINGNSAMSSDMGVDVTYDGSKLVFTNKNYGDDRTIAFSDVSAGLSNIGLSSGLTGTDGSDVEGKINGEVADGFDDVLLPKIGSKMTGVNFTVGEGGLGKSSFTFTRGLAGELNAYLANAIRDSSSDADPAPIALRESNINDGLKRLESDQESLNARIEKIRLRYTSQFSAMEAILSSFDSTKKQMESLLDTLPFTAKRN